MHVICVELSTEMLEATMPPNVTVVPAPKADPMMVTTVPPATSPYGGVSEVAFTVMILYGVPDSARTVAEGTCVPPASVTRIPVSSAVMSADAEAPLVQVETWDRE